MMADARATEAWSRRITSLHKEQNSVPAAPNAGLNFLAEVQTFCAARGTLLLSAPHSPCRSCRNDSPASTATPQL